MYLNYNIIHIQQLFNECEKGIFAYKRDRVKYKIDSFSHILCTGLSVTPNQLIHLVAM